MPFVKLDCGILDSSLWSLSPERELFITALLMAVPYHLDQPTPQLDLATGDPTDFIVPSGDYGIVRAAWVGVIQRAQLELNDKSEEAMKELGEPDPWSKSDAFGGRRLVRVDGGLLVLNFDTYRQKDHTAAERMRRFRSKDQPVTRCKRNVTPKTVTVTQAEAEAEADKVQTNEKRNVRTNGSSPTSDLLEFSLWIEALKKKPCYQGIDVKRELGKMRSWCEANKKQPTRRRFVNWLNRCDKPIDKAGKAESPYGKRYMPPTAELSDEEFARQQKIVRDGAAELRKQMRHETD